MDRARLVFVVHAGRVGSTALGATLARLPHLLWEGEIFTPSHHRLSEIERHQNWQEVIDTRSALASRNGYNIYGVEIKFYQLWFGQMGLSWPHSLSDFVSMTPYPVFTLIRANPLARLVSILHAQQSGKWHWRKRQKSSCDEDLKDLQQSQIEIPRIIIDRDWGLSPMELSPYLDAALARERELVQAVGAMSGECLQYEQMARDNFETGYYSIARKLGYGHRAIPDYQAPPLFRPDSRMLTDRIANLTEVRSWLRRDQLSFLSDPS